MLTLALHTFRERWTLFLGTLLSVALGVALIESSMLILASTSALDTSPGARRLASDITSFIGLTLTVSVFLSVFIIGSTFAFAVTERRRDLALLRLTGATRRQLRVLLVGEGVLVGLLGGALGVLSGTALVPLQLVSLRRLGMDVDRLDVELTPAGALMAIAAGLGTSLVGVWIASRRAARVQPLEALRDIGAAARVMTPARWFWGLVSAAATAAAVLTTQISSDPLAGIALSIAVIFTASVSLQQLSPLLVPLVGALAGVVARRWAESEIAHANLVDARRRAATTAGPLIALVGIVIGLYGVVLTQSAANMEDRLQSTTADLVVNTTADEAAAIRALPGVSEAVPLVDVSARLVGPGRSRRVTVVATDPTAFHTLMTPRLAAGATADFTGDTAIINGDPDGPFPTATAEVRLVVGERDLRLPVVARTGIALTDFSAATIPLDQVDPALIAGAPARIMVGVAPTATAPAVRRALDTAGYRDVQTVTAWAHGDQEATADANLAVTLGLAGLGGVYALLAVINAVALAAAARKREFAVDQLSGMTRHQVIRTTVLEALAVALIGIGLGGLAAGLSLVGIRRALESILGQAVLVVPWAAIAIVGSVSLLTVALTAAVATWRATRTPPITLAAAHE